MFELKKLQNLFAKLTYNQGPHAAFNDLLDWMLIPFKYYDSAIELNEAHDKLRGHSKKEILLQIMTEVGELAEGFKDPLGELFMLEISNGHNGQYFTPDHICDMMATMNVAEAEAGQTVYDCACGSGRMLLSAAKINRLLLFYGADLDITCCKMALLNMLLNSLTGEIAHMDSLSNRFYTGFKVQTKMISGYHTPYYVEFTDAELSKICLQPKYSEPVFATPFEPVKITNPIMGVQGSLF